MSDAALAGTARQFAARVLWRDGVLGATAWLVAAAATVAAPDVVKWGSTELWAWLMLGGAGVLLVASLTVHRLGRAGGVIVHYGPWLIAIGVWFAVWEVVTAKLGWLPKPFFSPPQGLLHVYLVDGRRLALCLPPTTFEASVFLGAIASGGPVAILTASGVGSVNRAYYDVARTLGASERFLIWKVAVPASLPHVFVGLFMGLYYSFAVLVVAEMLGARYGLGWYLSFETGYSAYANVYATLVIMALMCAGLVKLLFVGRDRLLSWQQGII